MFNAGFFVHLEVLPSEKKILLVQLKAQSGNFYGSVSLNRVF